MILCKPLSSNELRRSPERWVLTEVEAAAAQRAQELSVIVDGVIADLNRLLQGAPKILTGWRRVVM